MGWPRPLDSLYLRETAQIVSAEIDPTHQVLLDRNFYNNSYVVKADHRAAHKVATLFLFVTEYVSQLFGWLT